MLRPAPARQYVDTGNRVLGSSALAGGTSNTAMVAPVIHVRALLMLMIRSEVVLDSEFD